MRSASRLLCSVPDAAVVNPGSSKITHEPLSSSFTLRDRDGLSVVTLISVPARTLVSPVTGKSLPLRLRTTGGCAGAPAPPARPPGAPRPAAPGPGAPARAGAAPGPPAPGPPPRAAGPPGPPAPAGAGPAPRPPPKPPRPKPTVMRPTSPLHTAAFQVGLISQASS